MKCLILSEARCTMRVPCVKAVPDMRIINIVVHSVYVYEHVCMCACTHESQTLHAEGHIPAEAVQWLRPHEFMSAPTLFVGGQEIITGCLGDIWFRKCHACDSYHRHETTACYRFVFVYAV
jgi:hypothetical protein